MARVLLMRRSHLAPLCLIGLVTAVNCGRIAQAAEFFGLGFLPSYDRSQASDVSENGKVVVGVSRTSPAGDPYINEDAFRWTRETGMQAIGDARYSQAHTISRDGNVVAGIRWGSSSWGNAFYWTEETGAIDISVPTSASGPGSWVRGASADGSTLVGWHGSLGAYRWTAETGVVSLGPVSLNAAEDVSADGDAIVGPGSALTRGEFYRAWRWTPATGAVFLSDSNIFSTALAVSGDGSTVVGYFRPDGWLGANHAFRWTDESGMVGLELSGVVRSSATDVSEDGSVIVGNALFQEMGLEEAFIWSGDQGMRPLEDVLIDDYGLSDSLSGWTGLRAGSISGDGRTIVGNGTNPNGLTEAFLAYLGAAPIALAGDYNGNGTVEQADLDLVLLNWGKSAMTPPAGWTNGLPSGAIDQNELDGVLLNWGNTRRAAVPSPAAVPEPRAIVLLVLAVAAIIAARRNVLRPSFPTSLPASLFFFGQTGRQSRH